jgi:L-fuconolactonase
VDVKQSDADETLRRLADQGASGVRFHQTARSPGDDPLKIWRVAQELKLSVSCNGKGAYYASEEFAELVAALPDLPIAIEHLGSLNMVEKDPVPIETRREVFKLARFPNVSMKLHGLGEFCRRVVPAVSPQPFEQPLPPLFEMAHDAFGPSRLMWGSDYPPVSAREGYRNALVLAQEQFAAKSEEDRRQIFGDVALRLFPIRI